MMTARSQVFGAAATYPLQSPTGAERTQHMMTLTRHTSCFLLLAAMTLASACGESSPDALNEEDDVGMDDEIPSFSAFAAKSADPDPANVGPGPGQISDKQEMWGKCLTRTWYGNFGTVPFAKVWLYPGAQGECFGIRTAVGGKSGATTAWTWDTNAWVGGVDPWGESVWERQATGPGPAYGVGQYVCLNGVCYLWSQ